MRAECVRRSSTIACLLAISLAHPAGAADGKLCLTEAVRQALEANLDLAAQRRALAAGRQQVNVARSALLPQIDLGARAQQLDDDRSDGDPDSIRERLAGLDAGITQVLYDENAWAGFDIQKHVYDAQRSQLETTRLGVIRDAANAFLQLEDAREVASIEERNRELTERNVQTSRARVAAGYSGEREVLRWQAQLAQNDGAITQARAIVLGNRFELNRVRNRPPEEAVDAEPVQMEEYGFVYARDALARALADPDHDRRLRDVMVREGLSRSPVLAEIDASIAAQQRQLQASRRAFWVPSASVGAGINHARVDERIDGSSESYDERVWTVGAELSFPLVEGGAKLARLRQARETLSSLRIQRRSEALSIEERIRAAFTQASGSHAILGFARQQESAAQRNFELVNDSYVAGVASIVDLLDAQNQLLSAQLAVANAFYGFLIDLIDAEEATAFYPFLEPEPEVTRFLDRLEQELTGGP
jgi:outer membrane protein TolC